MRSGDQNWVSVSRAVRPFGAPNRPLDWFSQKNCAMQYSELLENVETPRRKRGEREVVETPGDVIVRKLTIERIEELKKVVAEEKEKYRALKADLESVQSGQYDAMQMKEKWERLQAEKAATEAAEAQRLAAELAARELAKAAFMRPKKPMLATTSSSSSLSVVHLAVTGSDPEDSMQDSLFDAAVNEDSNNSSMAASVDIRGGHPTSPTSPTTPSVTGEGYSASEAMMCDLSQPTILGEEATVTTTSLVDVSVISSTTGVDIVSDMIDVDIKQEPSSVEPAAVPVDSVCTEMEGEAEGVVKMISVGEELVKEETVDEEITAKISPIKTESPVKKESPVKIETYDVIGTASGHPGASYTETTFTDDGVNVLEVMNESLGETRQVDVETTPLSSSSLRGVSLTDKSDSRERRPGTSPKKQSRQEEGELRQPRPETTGSSLESTVGGDTAGLGGSDMFEEDNSKEMTTMDAMSPASSIVSTETGSVQSSRVSRGRTNKRGRGSSRPSSRTRHSEEGKESEISSKRSEADTSDDEGHVHEQDDSSFTIPTRRRLDASESLPNSPASISHSDTEDEKIHKIWKKSIMLVWRSVANHKYANTFLHPVTDDIAPGYHSIVLRPMDLTTIKKNIDIGVIRTTAEFQRDMMLIFTNAIMYNDEEHDVHRRARDMYRDVMAQIEQYVNTQMMMQTEPKSLRALRRSEAGLSDKEDDAKKRHNSEVDQPSGSSMATEAKIKKKK